MSTLPNDAPSPRLCIIVKWPDFEGYGFNLHAEKSKPGQYIGKVDENSPAETAGLLEDDRIIEVNGVNIANENHKQVVQRIKAIPNETRLLVLDPSADKYYKNKNIVVRGTQENVVVRSSAREETAPPPIPEPQSEPSESVSNGRHDEPDNRSVSSHASSSAASEASTQPQHASTVPEGDKDNKAAEEVTTTTTTATTTASSDHNTMENEDNTGVTLTIKTEDDDSGDVNVIEEGVESMNVNENVTEDNVNDDSEGKESEEPTPPAADEEVGGVSSEGTLDVVDPKEQEEVEHKDETDAVTPSSPEQESDLEAEYDNVEIDLGSQRESQTAADTRRLSTSSGKSSTSSHDGTDTPCTDTPTAQTPMSTSPTPPPSLDPEPLRTTASATTTTTTTTTTNNASPQSQPVPNKNTYNTSGLNLNMSAAEMRAMLARKKKADPRKETVDLKTKYEIIQNM